MFKQESIRCKCKVPKIFKGRRIEVIQMGKEDYTFLSNYKWNLVQRSLNQVNSTSQKSVGTKILLVLSHKGRDEIVNLEDFQKES